MKALKIERIKDAIIDYIYDYCFNDKVKKIEGAQIKLQIDPNYDYSKDEVTQRIKKFILGSKGPISMKYEERQVDYCEVATDNTVHSAFLDRLERIGIRRKTISQKDINSAIQYLVDKSYAVRDQPLMHSLKLTDKGIYHYENGQSFEQRYNDRYIIRNANTISLLSLLVAGISLAIAIFMQI